MKLIYLFVVVIISNAVFGQLVIEPPPPPVEIDNRPLERPVVMLTIEVSNPLILFDSVEAVLTAKGFEIDNRNNNAQELNAIRKTAAIQNGFEKLLIWLERDFNSPQTNIKIYIQYAVYRKLFGSGNDYKRIKVSAEEESEKLRELKTAIRKINFN